MVRVTQLLAADHHVRAQQTTSQVYKRADAATLNKMLSGTLSVRDIPFHKDRSISPFVRVNDKIDLSCDHKWSYPFIADACQRGVFRKGAIMTLWEMHAREDFLGIVEMPPEIKPGEDSYKHFKYATEHLTRQTFNLALIMSGLVSEIIVVCPNIETLTPVSQGLFYGMQRKGFYTVPHFTYQIPVFWTKKPMTTIGECKIGDGKEIPITFCYSQQYVYALNSALARNGNRDLINNFDLDLYTTYGNFDPVLDSDRLNIFPENYLTGNALKKAAYSVLCASTEMLDFLEGHPDNTPEIAVTSLNSILPVLLKADSYESITDEK